MENRTFTDANGVVNFFDDNRIKDLSTSLVTVFDVIWPKAKPDDIMALTSTSIQKLLNVSGKHDVLAANGRAEICTEIADELNLLYTHRCKPRVSKNNRKPTKKQLLAHESEFLQYSSTLAFIVFGEIRKKYQLVGAEG